MYLLAITIFLIGSTVFSASAFAQVEHIVNGDFETGTTAGWTTAFSGVGPGWLINDGTLEPPSPTGPTAPIAGSFDIVSVQEEETHPTLSQPFVVPTDICSASVSWMDRIFNYATEDGDGNGVVIQEYAPGIQEARVQILDSSGTVVLGTVFSTNPGDPDFQPGPNPRIFDITALMQSLQGQSVRLAFNQNVTIFYFDWFVDNVSLTTTGCVVGGEILGVDMPSLLVAGVFANSSWLAPTLAGIAAAGAASLLILRKKWTTN
jgi:hypothetical protein